MPDDPRQRIALWRFQILAPLLDVERRRGTFRTALDKVVRRPHDHPDRGQIQVGRSTIQHWLAAYRRDGLDGLMPVPRRDRGTSRRIDDLLAEAIETLATDRPQLDGPGLLAELRTVDPRPLPSLPTLYRFLRARRLDQRAAPTRRDHRAFTFDLAGDCWQGDVMYGPTLPNRSGGRDRTYLIAILDDATRLIAHAEFYSEQHLYALKDCLKQALLKRGLPRRLYFDNGKIFRSRLIQLVAARLGIHLIHTRPYQPQGRAKLERWFGTVRRSFLAHLDLDRIDDLDALNRLLFAWVEGVYHRAPHRGIDRETPLDRWLRLSEGIRPLPRDVDLDDLFFDETSRRVGKDGTLTLGGKTFEAGPRFIGQRVTVRFDPFDRRRIFVRSNNSETVTAYPVDRVGNRSVRRLPHDSEPTTAKTTRLRALEQLADELNPPTVKETDDEDDQDPE